MYSPHSIRRFLSLMLCVLMTVSLFPVSAFSEEVPETEHTHDYVPAVTAPTCTQDGYTTYTCSTCGDSYQGDPVSAPGHSWDGGTVTTPATTDVEGVMTYTCTVCGATTTSSIPVLENTDKEYRELETLELEIPGTPEYPTLWVQVVDRNSQPMKDVLLELVLPSGGSAGWFSTDENGNAACDLSGTGDSTLAYLQRHQDDRSGYGPVSPIAVALDGGSLVSVQGQAETGFAAGNPYVMKVYPAQYTVTLVPNGGAFPSGNYSTFEVLAEESDTEEPYGYLPTDRFEAYRPSEAFENQNYESPVLEGYAVSGWYTESEGGEPVVFDEYGNGTRLYTPETALYAHWQAIDYHILVDSGIAHGSVSASVSTANIRDTVVLTVVPESIRYELASLSIRQGDGELPLTANTDGTWSFTMPAGDVTVSAAFREVTVDSAVALVWDDGENRDGIRPDEMLLTLMADGEALKSDVVVTAEGNWTATEAGLPKYSETEQEINYSWTEPPLRGYEVHSETADGVTTLTNTLMPLYGITIDAVESGSVLARMGEAEVAFGYAGDSITLAVIPEEGYEPDTLSVKQGETDVELARGEDGTWSFTLPAGDVTVSAAFRAIIYTVAVSEMENGTVLADKAETTMGETVSLAITPATGYELDVLTVKQGEADVELTAGEDGTWSFTMPAGDVTISALFKATVYTVTVNETENGTVSVDKTEATMGEAVAVTLAPGIGYLPDGLSVTGSDGSDIAVTDNSFVMPALNVEVSASFAEGTPVFMTHSLTLGGELGINFFLELPELEGVDYSDSYMTFSVNDQTLRDSFDADDTDLSGNGYYGFTCTVNALQMADEITAVYHYNVAGEEKTVSQVYTVETYLNALLESEEISDEVKALARALADYGYYSQTFLSDSGYWTIGTEHNGMTTRFTDSYSAEQLSAILQALAGQEVQRDSNANIRKVTYSLYLDSKTSIYLYLQPAADYSGDISAAVDGQPVSVVPEAGGRYRVTIPDLSADQLGDMHQVVISTDGADPLTVQVSALSYVKACLEDENASDSMIDAMAALYYYSTASSALQQAS